MNKEKILHDMEQRMAALRERIERDYGGNLVGYNEAFREVKYWKEAIERGCFDDPEFETNNGSDRQAYFYAEILGNNQEEPVKSLNKSTLNKKLHD